MSSEATVFLVDDDADLRKALTRLLQTEGYRVVALGSAEEFLKLQPATGGCCLILDVSMPGIGGLELQQHLTRAGITVPIVPGIMPISNFSQLRRFSEMCGAEIPRWLTKRLHALGDDADAIREFSADVVAELCRRLVAGGAPGLHFYTLNRAKATLAVYERLAPA